MKIKISSKRLQKTELKCYEIGSAEENWVGYQLTGVSETVEKQVNFISGKI